MGHRDCGCRRRGELRGKVGRVEICRGGIKLATGGTDDPISPLRRPSILSRSTQSGADSFFGGMRVARRDSSSNVFYYLVDNLDSSRVIAEVPSGQTTPTMCYDADFEPYGGEHAYLNSCPQNYKFTSKERDTESGLDNFGARYYASTTGRFMSPDWALKPIAVPYATFGDPQTLNLYTYVENSPLNRIDADGHEQGDPDAQTAPIQGSEQDRRQERGPSAGQEKAQAQNNPPPPDANHTHTLTVREVEGQQGNPAGHVTVQVDNGKEVGFGPVQDLTKKQIVENTPVPGQVEPRANVGTKDAVTIYLTKDEAAHAQGTIDARTSNPGNYQLRGRSCVDFGEDVVRSTGARVPSDTLPSHLIRDLRAIQIQDNTSQAP